MVMCCFICFLFDVKVVIGVVSCDKGFLVIMMVFVVQYNIVIVLVFGGVMLFVKDGEDNGKV